MSQDNLIRLQCAECQEYNYYTSKNIKKLKNKIELKKYCPRCRKHTWHKEKKKK